MSSVNNSDSYLKCIIKLFFYMYCYFFNSLTSYGVMLLFIRYFIIFRYIDKLNGIGTGITLSYNII